jgi:hypothetical protein
MDCTKTLPERSESTATDSVADALLAALRARQRFSSMLHRQRAVVDINLQSLLEGAARLKPQVLASLSSCAFRALPCKPFK